MEKISETIYNETIEDFFVYTQLSVNISNKAFFICISTCIVASTMILHTRILEQQFLKSYQRGPLIYTTALKVLTLFPWRIWVAWKYYLQHSIHWKYSGNVADQLPKLCPYCIEVSEILLNRSSINIERGFRKIVEKLVFIDSAKEYI